MNEVKIRDSYIKLGQALKLAGAVGSGVDAKMMIQNGEVLVNDEVCTMRGKKLVDGDLFTFEGKSYIIKSEAL